MKLNKHQGHIYVYSITVGILTSLSFSIMGATQANPPTTPGLHITPDILLSIQEPKNPSNNYEYTIPVSPATPTYKPTPQDSQIPRSVLDPNHRLHRYFAQWKALSVEDRRKNVIYHKRVANYLEHFGQTSIREQDLKIDKNKPVCVKGGCAVNAANPQEPLPTPAPAPSPTPAPSPPSPAPAPVPTPTTAPAPSPTPAPSTISLPGQEQCAKCSEALARAESYVEQLQPLVNQVTEEYERRVFISQISPPPPGWDGVVLTGTKYDMVMREMTWAQLQVQEIQSGKCSAKVLLGNAQVQAQIQGYQTLVYAPQLAKLQSGLIPKLQTAQKQECDCEAMNALKLARTLYLAKVQGQKLTKGHEDLLLSSLVVAWGNTGTTQEAGSMASGLGLYQQIREWGNARAGALGGADLHIIQFDGAHCDTNDSTGWHDFYSKGDPKIGDEQFNINLQPWERNTGSTVAVGFALTTQFKGRTDQFQFNRNTTPTLNGKSITPTNKLQALGNGVFYRWSGTFLSVVTPNTEYAMLYHEDGYGNMSVAPIRAPHIGGFPHGIIGQSIRFDELVIGDHPMLTTGSTCDNSTVEGKITDYKVAGPFAVGDRYSRYGKNIRGRARDNFYPFAYMY